MRDVERYQRELDTILRDAEEKAKRASDLHTIDSIEQLFARGVQLGISHSESWRIIEETPSDPRMGLLALIQTLRDRSK